MLSQPTGLHDVQWLRQMSTLFTMVLEDFPQVLHFLSYLYYPSPSLFIKSSVVKSVVSSSVLLSCVSHQWSSISGMTCRLRSLTR